MKEIKIAVSRYKDGIEFVWEDNFKIKTSAEFDTLTISANREGLISLARHILLLAQENVPDGSHFHLDEFSSLEYGSKELLIARNDRL